MTKLWTMLLAVAALAGCGGEYTLTVPDSVTPAGEDAPVVLRLQRNDFLVLDLPVEQAAMRLRAGKGIERGAYTDRHGYAGTTVPVPQEPGVYTLQVDHQDSEYGDEVHGTGRVYVWQKDRPIVAVDLDCVPLAEAAASAGLSKLAQTASIAYFTREPVSRHDTLHEQLRTGGFPDGPILLWKRQKWHLERGKWGIPTIEVETRLVSELSEMRKTFPMLRTGIAGCPLGARAFSEAGMRTVLVGDISAPKGEGPLIRVPGWGELGSVSP
ncbi:MAG: hypothetical protein ACLFV7_11540 [Phycisphaerae bacterium]